MKRQQIEGQQAARSGKPKSTCPYDYTAPIKKAHWLAGWHDFHIQWDTRVFS